MSNKILFINACVRCQSRTIQLADYLLDRLSGDVTRRDLEKEDLKPLCKDLLEKREQLFTFQYEEGIPRGLCHAKRMYNCDSLQNDIAI